MSLPNKGGGGTVHLDRKTASPYNNDRTSRAMFATEASETGNRPGWIHEGLEIRTEAGEEAEPARQCAATSGRVCLECSAYFNFRRTPDIADMLACPDCNSTDLEYERCEEIAVPGYMTCAQHGGGFKLSASHRAAALRGTVKTGGSFNQILFCPCNMFKDACKYKELYFDEDGEARCFPEKQLFDQIIEYISLNYELDGAADQIVLNRLAMAMLRIKRAEKLVAKDGEVVERSRASNDGSVERWFEPNSAGTVVDKLDKSLLAWLKSLNVTRKDRQAHQTIAGVNDIAALLSDSTIAGETILEIQEENSQ